MPCIPNELEESLISDVSSPSCTTPQSVIAVTPTTPTTPPLLMLENATSPLHTRQVLSNRCRPVGRSSRPVHDTCSTTTTPQPSPNQCSPRRLSPQQQCSPRRLSPLSTCSPRLSPNGNTSSNANSNTEHVIPMIPSSQSPSMSTTQTPFSYDMPNTPDSLSLPIAQSSSASPLLYSLSVQDEIATSPSNDPTGRRRPMMQEPPAWIPDRQAPRCMACGASFTIVRRRHHCRNCGKVSI